jgi:hypothetical protein
MVIPSSVVLGTWSFYQCESLEQVVLVRVTLHIRDTQGLSAWLAILSPPPDREKKERTALTTKRKAETAVLEREKRQKEKSAPKEKQ